MIVFFHLVFDIGDSVFWLIRRCYFLYEFDAGRLQFAIRFLLEFSLQLGVTNRCIAYFALKKSGRGKVRRVVFSIATRRICPYDVSRFWILPVEIRPAHHHNGIRKARIILQRTMKVGNALRDSLCRVA